MRGSGPGRIRRIAVALRRGCRAGAARARVLRTAAASDAGRALALGAGAVVLASAALSADGGGSPEGETAARAAEGRGAVAAAAPAAGPRQPAPCDDGERAAASLRPSGADGTAVKRIKKRGKLVVGVDQNSYLWGYRDPATGDIEGFDIDLARAIARDLVDGDGPGKLTFRTIPTDQRIPALRKRDVDMVVRTMTITCERSREVAFSTAYFEAGQQLLAPKKGARVKGFDSSMRGKRVCYAAGSTAEELMTSGRYQKLGARPVVVANQLDCLVRMQLGEADATVTDSALGAGQAAQDSSVELIGEPVTEEPYGVAMNLRDEDLVRRVNRVLDTFRAGQWSRSYGKWLKDGLGGTKDGGKAKPPKPLYRD
ncbi:glutamate ABC transporter substrate-binding protein [Streptomyces boncukensis]|uniref:Glutamate ABC transporter substrate-binding protein n=1 Tax=Streptomyces boncukensis TaxID=2711219 RepID=A0A6G4WY89_9ACTN|nr:glutamate ABC transporter substrate-binding protein [Streptomyces boncukensis]NGO69577.1 glutamate ABC transporter substrate-binding protein [Streptomyces boncukensis]